MNWLNSIVYMLAAGSAAGAKKNTESNATVGPIYDFLDTFGPVLISLLLAVGVIYCIVLGVQYARAEKGEERDTAKKKAINAAISFLVIIILLVLLYAFRDTFVELLSD